MEYCTACQKAIATVVVMDLTEGAVTGSQHLCQACAEQLGVGSPKAPKLSPEILEDLLGSMQPARKGPRPTAGCPGCGMSVADFRSKGRLGCPRCYDAFRAELLPLLQRIHEAQAHTGRLPAVVGSAPQAPDERSLTDVRRRLEDAVRGERYEEAARLRDELRKLERGATS
jgi:protein arginine kinase activator